jgi:hypothetical protein
VLVGKPLGFVIACKPCPFCGIAIFRLEEITSYADASSGDIFHPDSFIEVAGIKNAHPGDEFFACPIVGDGLLGDGIFEGDLVICRKVSNPSEITHGRLTVLDTPCGLVIAHAYLGIGKIRLSTSNPNYPDHSYPLGDVEIIGVVARVERDYQ